MKRANVNSPEARWIKAKVVCGGLLCAALATAVFAQQATSETGSQVPTTPFSVGKVFTFLFMTLGPFKIIGPFAELTRGRDRAFKRQLAFQGIIISVLAMLAAATVGANTLQSWGVSVGALQLAAGLVLFLIALKPVLEQYEPKEPEAEAELHNRPAPSASALAFSPLAFPTIVTPYGVAVLILIVTLRPNNLPEILGVAALVMGFNLVAMFLADYILKSPWVAAALGIVGSVMAILQVALGVQVVVDALRVMRVV